MSPKFLREFVVQLSLQNLFPSLSAARRPSRSSGNFQTEAVETRKEGDEEERKGSEVEGQGKRKARGVLLSVAVAPQIKYHILSVF